MGVIRALIENPEKLSRANMIRLIPRAIIGLIALLCGNAYIVGINQIYDVKIDEINKPFLPIAAKLMTQDFAWKLIIGCLITGMSIVKTQFSSQIFAMYSVGVVLGTAYSVPPIQLKRKALFAGSIIAVVRGFLLNFGVYYAVREALEIPFKWNPVVAFISSFMTVFATVIAITKDLPDVEGDKKYDIETFASKYGVKAVARISSALLVLAYVYAIAVPFTTALGGPSFNKVPMVGGHASFLVYFLWSFMKFDQDPTSNPSSLKRFYKSIWNLFYLEYCLYPLI
jgi:homogentisate solanesyltransferase